MAARASLAPVSAVSVAVVARNEESALPGLLDDLRAQSYPHDRIELILVDSMSEDGTRAVMERFAAENPAGFKRVAVLGNPGVFQACGWNVALGDFREEAFIRIDAHASVPPDFVEANVAVLNRGEAVCGGPRPTVLRNPTDWQKTLHLAEESAFGSSPAGYRSGEGEGKEVPSLFHGAYRRCVTEAVGPMNEELLRTEDNDWNYRVRRAGYRIWFDPSIRSQQFARPTLGKMLEQKYGNGFWVGRTLFVQPKCLQLHHLVPLAFVLGIAAMAAVGFAFSWVPFGVCAALYLLLCIALAVKAVAQSDERNWTAVALPLVFAGIHLSYGVGTLFGLVSGLAHKLFGGKAAAAGGKGGGAGSGAAA